MITISRARLPPPPLYAGVANDQPEGARLEVEGTRPPYDEALKPRRELVKRGGLSHGMRPAHVARGPGTPAG